MRMQIYHTRFCSPVDYMEVNRYHLLLDGGYIFSTARGLPYKLPELLERFLNYIKMNPSQIMTSYNKKITFSKPMDSELILDKDVPEIGLMIKEMIVEQKLNDIKRDFV